MPFSFVCAYVCTLESVFVFLHVHVYDMFMYVCV